MFNHLRRKMDPITLSRGLQIVVETKSRPDFTPIWYNYPLESFINFVGDIPIEDVTGEQIANWYSYVKTRPHRRESRKTLSAYTVHSYGRAMRAYFNHMVALGHLEKSPFTIKLSVLPRTTKPIVDDDDLDRMLRYASLNARDYAMLLIFRDSGARLGEIISMKVETTIIERFYKEPTIPGRFPRIIVLRDGEEAPEDCEEQWRGRSLVISHKTGVQRWLHFSDDAARSLHYYIKNRWNNDIHAVWLAQSQESALTATGARLMLKRIGRHVGAGTCTPHAFRHRLAKKMKEARVDPEIIASILGHASVETYQKVYGLTSNDELADYHTIFTDFSNSR